MLLPRRHWFHVWLLRFNVDSSRRRGGGPPGIIRRGILGYPGPNEDQCSEVDSSDSADRDEMEPELEADAKGSQSDANRDSGDEGQKHIGASPKIKRPLRKGGQAKESLTATTSRKRNGNFQKAKFTLHRRYDSPAHLAGGFAALQTRHCQQSSIIKDM